MRRDVFLKSMLAMAAVGGLPIRSNAMSVASHMTSATDIQASLLDKINRTDKYSLRIWANAGGMLLTPFSGWYASDFTGSGVPYYGENTQVKAEGAYGATCADLGAGKFGFFMNGFETAIAPGQQSWALGWGGPIRNKVKNWQGNSSFHYTYKEKLGIDNWFQSNTGEFTYLSLFIRDTTSTSNQYISLTVYTWDRRTEAEYSFTDNADLAPLTDDAGYLTGVLPYLGVALGKNNTYVSSLGDGFTHGPRTPGDTFTRTGSISKLQMSNIIARFKTLVSKAGEYDANGRVDIGNKIRDIANMSNNPDDYEIFEVFIQAEQYQVNPGLSKPNCNFGVSYSDVDIHSQTL